MATATVAKEIEHAFSPEEAQRELARRAAYKSFGAFFRLFEPGEDYVYGQHTNEIVAMLDGVSKSVEQGQCRYVIICVPPRHGKSDIGSRRYPAWHLIRNPNHEVILASYNYELARDMAYEARSCFTEAGSLYGLGIRRDRKSIDSWRVVDHRGGMCCAGIGGTITGRGANVLVIDDYIKNREEAESQVMRDKIWNSFRSDMMTRRAPVHAVIIIANRWHQDDLVGRIERMNNPKADNHDPKFPKFEKVVFPAQSENGAWLFPERFGTDWYESMKSMLGTYAWGAQGQQNPVPRTGNLLRADKVKRMAVEDMPPDLRWYRGWDLASSKKERTKENPDYTVGTCAAYRDGKIYVRDVVRTRGQAPERDRVIEVIAEQDGMGVPVIIEVVAGYKDTFHNMEALLSGKAVVRKFTTGKADKVARASFLEPIFEAGGVYIAQGAWNEEWLQEMASFPSGRHDDQVDSLVVAMHAQVLQRGKLHISS